LGGVKRLPLSRINPLTKTFNKNGKILSYSPNNKGYTHNGKEIVPIVECAKIAFPELDFILYEIERRGEFYAQCGDSKRVFYNRGIFYEMDGYGHTHPIEDQYLFFDYLHELKNRLPRPD
jgi:hypothetical protein